MGLVVLVVPLQVGNSAAMVRTGRRVLMVPVQDLDLMTGGMVLAVLMALGQMAREGQRVARQLRKGGNLDNIANQISRTRREISTTRRDSVGARDPLFSRAIVASDRPKFSASGAVKRKARLLPPKSTVIRGRGNQPIRLANGSFASATRTGLTPWTDPSVVVMLGPVRPSCLGAAIQSK